MEGRIYLVRVSHKKSSDAICADGKVTAGFVFVHNQ